MSHSVRSHLRLEIDAYDESIRKFIPGYEEVLSRAADEIADIRPSLVVDLGAGTGAPRPSSPRRRSILLGLRPPFRVASHWIDHAPRNRTDHWPPTLSGLNSDKILCSPRYRALSLPATRRHLPACLSCEIGAAAAYRPKALDRRAGILDARRANQGKRTLRRGTAALQALVRESRSPDGAAAAGVLRKTHPGAQAKEGGRHQAARQAPGKAARQTPPTVLIARPARSATGCTGQTHERAHSPIIHR